MNIQFRYLHGIGKLDLLFRRVISESFHYSIADGVESGAVPIIWPWDGAKEIYTEWIAIENTGEALSKILSTTFGDQEQSNRELIEQKYGLEVIFSKLENEMW